MESKGLTFALFFTVACLLVSIEAQSSESTTGSTAETNTTPSTGTVGTTSKKEDASPAAAHHEPAAAAPAHGTTSNCDHTTTTHKPHKLEIKWVPLGQLILNTWNSKFGRPNNNHHQQVHHG